MKFFTLALFALIAGGEYSEQFSTVLKFLYLEFLSTASCSPIDDVQPIDPRFDAYRDVRILLSTRENLGNPRELNFRDIASIQNSPFNPSRPTRILIHGWFEDETSDIKVETSRELLQFYDFNVLFIDWSEGSRTINYVQATQRVSPVGNFLASYLDFLHENNFLQFDRLSIIGFSLGGEIRKKYLAMNQPKTPNYF
jgi:predicted alpha/beta-fold hydrolase